MSSNPSIPSHLSEDDLLALVERQKVADPVAIRDAVEKDQEFGRLLRELRTDRAALTALAAGAPAGLLAEVEARLEREALVGLAGAEPHASPIPISSIVVSRTGAWQRAMESRGVRRFAMAAALVLVGGVVAMIGASVFKNAKPLPQPELARDDHGGGMIDPSDGDLALRDDLATNPESPDGLPSIHDAPVSPNPALANNTPIQTPPIGAPTQDPLLTTPTMTTEHALALASEGRLVIRIRSNDPQSSIEEVRQLTARSSRDVKWQALEAAPEIVMALAAREANTIRPPSKARPDTAIASDNPTSTPVPTAAQPVHVPMPSAQIRPLYTVEFRESGRSLESLLSVLDKSKDATVELVELDRPVHLRSSLDPAEMLWWGRPASEWGERMIVPIVLESR